MHEDYMERFRNADPATSVEFDADATRERVAQRLTQSPARIPGQRLQFVQYLAAAAALAVFAGGGYLTGVQRSTSNTQSLLSPGMGAPTDANTAGNRLGGPESSKVSSSYAGWFGNTVLKPSDAVTNVAGQAPAYGFDATSVDRVALARSIADVLGLDASLVKQQPDGYVGFTGNDSVTVDMGVQAQFWANSNERSPWNCPTVGDVSATEPGSTGSAGDSGSGGMEPAPPQQCAGDWSRPSDADALQRARDIVKRLQLPAYRDATFAVSWSDERSVAVSALGSIDGFALRGIELSIQVSSKGVFSIGGTGAKIVRVNAYPTAGARDVALRSALKKWSTFGPVYIGPSQPTTVAYPNSGTPTTAAKGSLLMPQAYVDEITVNSAKSGLQLQWFSGGEVLFLPAWEFTAADGGLWQMLALREDYIDWSASPSGVMPLTARAMPGMTN